MKKVLSIVLIVSLITMFCFNNIVCAENDSENSSSEYVNTTIEGEEASDNNENNDGVVLTGIVLNYDSMTLSTKSNETWGLIVISVPNGANLPEIVWTSSDESIVKVTAGEITSTATLTPVSAGTATITAKTIDNKYSSTCNIKVIEDSLIESIDATDEDIKTEEPEIKSQNADTTVAKVKIPQTGIKVISIVTIISFAVIVIISYRKYVKYRDLK